jgi:hypothetical protein
MSQFKVDKSSGSGALTLKFSGSIDEDAVFNEVTVDSSPKVVLDLDGVESINSCGIREWIKWLKTIPEVTKIEYQKCPKVIVDQINMVSGFLPGNAKVTSFYVPYYSEDSGNEKLVLFTEGNQYSGNKISAPVELQDESTGETLELDVIEAKYFKFLSSK